MTDDGGVVAGSAGERATVTNLLLDVADNGTLRALANGEDVANSELSLLASVDEGTSVKTLSRDEGLLAELVTVGVAENDAGKGCTTAYSSANRHTGYADATHRPASWIISFTIPLT